MGVGWKSKFVEIQAGWLGAIMTAMTEMTGRVHVWGNGTNSDPHWQHLLESYCYYEENHHRLVKWRAVVYVVLVYSVVNFLFLLDSSSHSHNAWFVACLIGIAIAIPLAIYCQLGLYKVMKQRQRLSREMFNAGLRVDEEQRLVTNTIRPKVVATIKSTVESQ